MKGSKTGGRQKGTPNKAPKCGSLKELLRGYSTAYLTPRPQIHPVSGEIVVTSDFELDMAALSPADRLSAQLRILEFHTPKMKAIEVDLDARVAAPTIEERLAQLCKEQ